MTRRFSLPSFAFVAASSIAFVAHAAPSDADRATARALARDGYEAEKRGEYAIAADRFGRAEALVHAPTLLLGLARAQAGLGKLVEAEEIYERIIRERLVPSSPPPFARAVEDAKRELADLSPRIAWVTIVVSGPTSPGVALDDAPVPAAALGVRRACNPGEHWVKAVAAGFASAERTFIVAEGSEQTISLPMDPLPAPVAAAPPQPMDRPASGEPLQTKLGIGVVALGAAGVVAGGAAGVWVLARHSSLGAGCPDGQCPASERGAVTAYRTVANLSTASLVAGGVVAAAGAVLLLTAPKTPSLAAYAGFTSAGVVGRF